VSQRRQRGPKRARDGPLPPSPALGARNVALAAAVCLGLTWIVYSATLRAPFVYDDVVIESCRPCRPVRLGGVIEVLFARGLPRPVTMMSFALNHYLGGAAPYGYHLVNLVLHGLVGTVLFVFIHRLLTLLPPTHAWSEKALPIAAVGTLAWLVHPVNSQVVAYVWQRSTSLSALFFLGSLLAYLEGRWGEGRPRAWLFAASAGLGLLALGAKQNAGTLPLFVLLLEAAFRPEGLKLGRRLAVLAGLLFVAFLGIAAFYLGPRFLPLMAGEFQRRGFTLTERLLTELRVVVHYLTLLVLPLPSRLNLDYDFPLSRGWRTPPGTLACLAVLAGLLAVAVWQFSRRRLLSLAILWFLGGLAIESTVIPLDIIYEHRLYVPSMLPLVFGVGLALTRLAGWPRARAAALAAILLALAIGSVARAQVWADPVRLFADTARKSPNKARVHANLGIAHLDRRDYAAAQRAFTRALELDPGLTGAANNLALIHLDQLRQPAEARRLLEDAAARKPRDAGTRVNLAVACWQLGDRGEAVRQLEAARELDTEDPRIPHNLAAAYLEMGDTARAAQVLDQALASWPQDADLRRLKTLAARP
jgi:tetratricopeptide (TPR) repeat protein